MRNITIAAIIIASIVSNTSEVFATKGRIITGVDPKSCVEVYGGKPMKGNRCMISYED